MKNKKVRRNRAFSVIMITIALLAGVKIYNFSFEISSVIAQENNTKENNTKENEADKTAKDASDTSSSHAEQDAAGPSQTTWTRSSLKVLFKLKERREALDARASEMNLREKTLNVLEEKINTKIESLKKIENQIAALVKTHDERSLKQIQSLVKTFSSMKPKKAALIFQKLNIEIQISLVEKMKEKITAKILENVDPAVAEKLTTELINRRKMPIING